MNSGKFNQSVLNTEGARDTGSGVATVRSDYDWFLVKVTAVDASTPKKYSFVEIDISTAGAVTTRNQGRTASNTVNPGYCIDGILVVDNIAFCRRSFVDFNQWELVGTGDTAVSQTLTAEFTVYRFTCVNNVPVETEETRTITLTGHNTVLSVS